LVCMAASYLWSILQIRKSFLLNNILYLCNEECNSLWLGVGIQLRYLWYCIERKRELTYQTKFEYILLLFT
jgi:hypothetical protein